MSFDRKLDQAIDSIGENVGQGISNFGINTIAPFFASVAAGVTEWQRKKLWKEKAFRKRALVTVVIAAMAAAFELFYFREIVRPYTAGEWLYYRQRLFPLPLAMLAVITSCLIYYNKLGSKIIELRQKFQLAFERSGLYSRKKVSTKDGEVPEYPFLIKDDLDKDGGRVYLFKNPGLPLESWIKAKPSLEATLETEIGNIEMANKNPGKIVVKLGGKTIPKVVEVTDELINKANGSSVVVGESADGVEMHNFQSIPHLLIGGTTGAGKTVVANWILYQFIKRLKGIPFLIDFKGGADYTAFESLGIEIIDSRDKVAALYESLKEEHHARVKLFKANGVRNIEEYNLKQKEPEKKLKRIVVLIDELAELTDPKSVPKGEHDLLDTIIGQLSSAARLYRSTGINQLFATQRPDANVVPGQIKNNVPGRVCGFFSDNVGYQIVLDYIPHPRLPSPDEQPGRFIYSLGARNSYIQVPYFQDKHVDPDIEIDYSTGVLTLQHELINQNVSPVPSRRTRYSKIDED